MDYHKILLTLTENTNDQTQTINDRLQKTLQQAELLFADSDKNILMKQKDEIADCLDVRFHYISTIIYVSKKIEEANINNTSENDVFSIGEFRTIRDAIQLITSIGIIPCLMPRIGISIANLQPECIKYCHEEVSDLEKYKRLSFAAESLVTLYKGSIFRPAIISELCPLLAALLQLHHAPLIKPLDTMSDNAEEQTEDNGKFVMTLRMYETLKKDQERFGAILRSFLNVCPQSAVIKELMIIYGLKNLPVWFRKEVKFYLVENVMQPNGVASIIAAVCDNIFDSGEHWKKLDVVARLIALPHNKDETIYFQAICPQLLKLLASNEVRHAATIANYCITVLYEENPNACIRHIVNVIKEPLQIELSQSMLSESQEKFRKRTESEVEECINNLHCCFVTTEAKFKQLPSKLLSNIATPLFSLYNDVRQSASILKSKLKQLLLRILSEEISKRQLFSHLLGHCILNEYGYFVISQFGATGGIEIVDINQSTSKSNEFAESLMDLIMGNDVWLNDLFEYLLDFLSESLGLEEKSNRVNLLETSTDVFEHVEKQIMVIHMLSKLANIPALQEIQLQKPDALLSFTKSLFRKYVSVDESDQNDCEHELLYLNLMLVKMMLSERPPSNWGPFNEFSNFLQPFSNMPSVPSQLSLLVCEVIKMIKTQNRPERRTYEDVSISRTKPHKFDEALRDLADPLLPVRAHGIITLTKLIEMKDPCTLARKSIVLRLFEENLKNDDSFIYLATINGFCALATTCPEAVLSTLIQEFIDMPQRLSSGDITVETRIKLGEIIVKTTRALGEMAYVHKNVLINAFLCTARDPEPLMRASSLSCLGELCKVLGFRMETNLTEIIYCITCIIKSDKAVECRRAAVLVITLLLRGLGKDTLTSLSKELVDLYRGLKYLCNNDSDPVLCLHAQLALEELHSIVRDFLLEPHPLVRKISI